MLDGLKLIPGLQLEGGNTLKLYGLSELTVYIDGRPQRMSKDEVISLLQSMSLSELSSVELIREPGVEYGGVTTPILNIKAKDDSRGGRQGLHQPRRHLPALPLRAVLHSCKSQLRT